MTSGVQAVVPGRSRGKTVAAAAGIVAVLAVAAALLWNRQKPSASAPPAPAPGALKPGIRRVAVLPFENLGAPEDDYFADGIADAIRGKLTSLPGLEVIARGSSTPYKKTTKPPQEIARELSANYLLTATVRWQKQQGGAGNRVQVSPELVEITADGPPASRWQQPFDAALTDVFQVQSDIATRVAKELGVALGTTEQKGLTEKPTQNLQAYEAYLHGEEVSAGLSVSDPASLRRALAFYEQAVALDPTFVQAWSAMATASSLLYANSVPSPELARRSQQAAEKAIAMAPTRAEGYVALGTFRRLVLRDFAGALDLYRKAQAISPADASLLRAIGNAELGLGHFDRAAEMFRQASRLDPRGVANLRWLGDSLLRSRRAVEAREVLTRALAIAPSSLVIIELRAMTFVSEGDLSGARASLQASASAVDPTALVSFLATYNEMGWVLDEPQRELLLRLTPSAFDDDRGTWGLDLAQAFALKKDAANTRLHAGEAAKAFEEQLKSAPDDPVLHACLGGSLAYLGRKDEAIREGERAVSLAPISKDGLNGPYIQHQLVRIYLVTGEPEKALDQLEPLLKMPYFLTPAWLKIDPNFDPLRKNPRFQKLVASGK